MSMHRYVTIKGKREQQFLMISCIQELEKTEGTDVDSIVLPNGSSVLK